MKSNRPILVLWLSIFLIATMANSQEFEDVQYTPVKVTANIYMLQGAGGNIGCFFGPDGLFLIDDQFAPLHQKLLDKIEDQLFPNLDDVREGEFYNTQGQLVSSVKDCNWRIPVFCSEGQKIWEGELKDFKRVRLRHWDKSGTLKLDKTY